MTIIALVMGGECKGNRKEGQTMGRQHRYGRVEGHGR
jgi:hypothetical protein